MKDALTDPKEPNRFRDIYSVSRLNREVRSVLEGSFPLIWVEGEISNLARPGSGHMYFSLKDEAAQVRCAMFRNRNLQLGFEPKNGMQVLLRARIGLYEARGEYQLIAEHMEETGDGALRRAFEALKQRLDKEGLFDTTHKMPLPEIPHCIGLITSPTGAAVHDMLSTLRRRFPALSVVVYPVPVQGTKAAKQIAAALRLAGSRKECDVIILSRGGGSLEDLWPFNEEVVARAIYECPIPVVTGIGHEIDFTIADFVADRRAPTPTGAAELISPDQQTWLQGISLLYNRLQQQITNQLALYKQKLTWLESRLQHPGRRLQDITQRLDDLELRLCKSLHHSLRHMAAQLNVQTQRLHHQSPKYKFITLHRHRKDLSHRLRIAIQHQLGNCQNRLGVTLRALDAISPLATLDRGYAVITQYPEGKLIRRARQLKKGDKIAARLQDGNLVCQVEEIQND